MPSIYNPQTVDDVAWASQNGLIRVHERGMAVSLGTPSFVYIKIYILIEGKALDVVQGRLSGIGDSLCCLAFGRGKVT